METKICRKCGSELPLSEFYKAKGNKDGHKNICKECFKQQITEWNTAHPECTKQYKIKWKTTHTEYVKNYNVDYLKTPMGRAVHLRNAYIHEQSYICRIHYPKDGIRNHSLRPLS